MTQHGAQTADAMTNHDGHEDHDGHATAYIKAYIKLLILTGMTVAAGQMVGGDSALLITISISSIKAWLVLSIFMHLRYEDRLYSLVFASSLFFLALFFVVTISEWTTRAEVNPEQGTYELQKERQRKIDRQKAISEGGATAPSDASTALEGQPTTKAPDAPEAKPQAPDAPETKPKAPHESEPLQKAPDAPESKPLQKAPDAPESKPLQKAPDAPESKPLQKAPDAPKATN